MARFKCEGCKKEHEDYNWKNTTYEFEEGERSGWFCSRYFKPSKVDLAPDRIKRLRKEHKKDLIQPFRGGEPNKEFVKEYPTDSKKYFTEKEIKKAKKIVL